MQTIDFCRSYLRFRIDLAEQPAITLTHKAPTSVNNVRINLECRCELHNRRDGRTHIYVLTAACKSERVGAQRDCWLQPNADFCVVASEEEFLVLKSWTRIGFSTPADSETHTAPMERQSGLNRDAWPKFALQMRPTRGRSLTTIDDIIGSIRSDRSIVARTEYDDGDFRVVIEHPVKTINYSELDDVFQTDTGPVLLPDLSAERLQKCERLVECFDLAFAAFNSPRWTEFIVNVPTPICDGISVNHYSKARRIEPVENSLVEILPELPTTRVGTDRAIRVDGSEPLASAGNGAAGNRRGSEVVTTTAEKGDHR